MCLLISYSYLGGQIALFVCYKYLVGPLSLSLSLSVALSVLKHEMCLRTVMIDVPAREKKSDTNIYHGSGLLKLCHIALSRLDHFVYLPLPKYKAWDLGELKFWYH